MIIPASGLHFHFKRSDYCDDNYATDAHGDNHGGYNYDDNIDFYQTHHPRLRFSSAVLDENDYGNSASASDEND